MLMLTRKDLIGSVATGVTGGVIAWQLARYFLHVDALEGIPLKLLPVVVPILWLICVELGHQLGRYWPFFSQFGRFVVIGLTNAAVDFGLFNLLFAFVDQKPELFLWTNVGSFAAAVMHSYLWNKFWTFESDSTHNAGREFVSFVGINVVSTAVNAGVAYVVFYELVTLVFMTVTAAANVGKVCGALVGLIINFIGFRLVVFRKRHDPFDDPYVV